MIQRYVLLAFNISVSHYCKFLKKKNLSQYLLFIIYKEWQVIAEVCWCKSSWKESAFPSDNMSKEAESSCLVVFQNLTFYLFQMMKFLDFGNNIDYLQIIV